MGMTESFTAWKLYTTLKLHFTTEKYDFHKYGGRAKNLSVLAFERRKDRRYFYVIAKRYPKEKDLIDFYVANMLVESDIFPAFIVSTEAKKNYENWKERQGRIVEIFREDLKKVEDFKRDFSVMEGQYPKLLSLFLADEISAETISILNVMLDLSKVWNGKMNDPVTWPKLSMKFRKYHPFILYDYRLVKQAFIEKFDLNKNQ